MDKPSATSDAASESGYATASRACRLSLCWCGEGMRREAEVEPATDATPQGLYACAGLR